MMDEKWMKERKITAEELNEVYGKISIPNMDDPENPEEVTLVDLMHQYKDRIKAIDEGNIKRAMDKAIRRIQNDEDTRRNIDFIRKFATQLAGMAVKPDGQKAAPARPTLKAMGTIVDKFKTILNDMSMSAEFRSQPAEVTSAHSTIVQFLGNDSIQASTNIIDKIGLFNRLVDEVIDQKVLSDDEIKQLRQEIKAKREMYGKQKLSVERDPIFNALTLRDSFTKEPIRKNDGFISWEPVKDLRMVSKELAMEVSKPDNTPTIASLIDNLKLKLREYRTTDRDLIEKKNKLLAFFGSDGDRNVQKLNEHSAEFSRFLQDFLERANQHGKVIIFSNIENSILCVPPSEPKGGFHYTGGRVLDDFAAANTANIVRDRSMGKNIRGKRTIIFVSAGPVSNLPTNAVVELGDVKVDLEEAKIIINHLLKPYADESRNIKRMHLINSIEGEYEKKDGDPASLNKQKRKELREVQGILKGLSRSFGRLPMEAEKQMEQMIIGMSLKHAINVVENCLSSNLIYNRDDDGNVTELTLDTKSILKDLAGRVNETALKDVIGIEIREPAVEFEQYAYKKVSEWGEIVGRVGFASTKLIDIREEIRYCETKIAQIEQDLTNGVKDQATNTHRPLTSTEVSKFEKLKIGLQNKIKHAELERSSVSKHIPHLTLLYGSPGVGKSIWADAIASLLNLMIRDVDLTVQRDKWVGNTAKNTARLVEAMKSARDSVYLIDEVDRQMTMEHGSQGTGSGESGHETTRGMVSQFLNLFEKEKKTFIDHNVFIVMTTNHIEGIDTAMMERTDITAQVQAPDQPEDYQKFLESFLAVEYKKDPDHPWFTGGTDQDVMQGWNTTFELIQKLDIPRLAHVFAEKQIPFRQVSKIMEEAIIEHQQWEMYSAQVLAKGIKCELRGMPLTSENIIGCATMAETATRSNHDRRTGVSAYGADKLREAEELMKGRALEEIERVDPFTEEVGKGYKLPDDILAVMRGEVSNKVAEVPPQYAIEEQEIDDLSRPGQKRKQVSLIPIEPGKAMEELRGNGFQETPINEGVPQQKTPLQQPQQPQPDPSLSEPDAKKKQKSQEKQKSTQKDTDKGEKVKSSTDYLFNFLVKQGIINEGNQMVSQQQPQRAIEEVVKQNGLSEPKIYEGQNTGVNKPVVDNVQPQQQQPKQPTTEDYEARGVYDYGQVLVAPTTSKTPPQHFGNVTNKRG
ncbi:MAG: ATP-binding protein [Methanomassiliicoccales archaeon]